MDYSAWLKKATDKIETIPIGYEFCVKDLFEGVEWNELPKGERLMFGKVFKNDVFEGQIHSIIFVGKASNNSATYRKV